MRGLQEANISLILTAERSQQVKLIFLFILDLFIEH